ncbi:MAG: glycosyltransferase family 4 protein [Nitrospirae bacterium]|nr:glycosyltransferase family 4 protein [Nitrospirota bacterium]
MKVALVSIRFDTRGGSERRTYQLARGLIGAGHEVEIFAAHVLDMDLDAKVTIVPMMHGPSFVKVMSFTRNVGRVLGGRKDIDVIHNQIRPFTEGVVTVGGGCHAEYMERTGSVLGYINPLDRVILNMEKSRYTPAGRVTVITNSELARQGILRHYPIPPERVHVAYNGVDTDKFHPAKVSATRAVVRARHGLGDGPVALFVGAGFRRKGLETVIKAVAVAAGMANDIKHIKLLVVGKDEPGPFMRLAEKLGVGDRVIFAGPTNRPEEYYGACDIFTLPTVYDPFSNATIEAMACGMPVITSRDNGVSEVIEDGESGYLLRKHDDHVGLASSLAYLACEKARRAAGAQARLAAESLTWEKTLAKTLEVYRLHTGVS